MGGYSDGCTDSGSLVDGRNERNSGRYKPGKVLPARGRDLELYCEQPTLNPIIFTFTYLEVASSIPGGGVNLIRNSNLSCFGIYCHDFLATFLSLSTRFVLSQWICSYCKFCALNNLTSKNCSDFFNIVNQTNYDEHAKHQPRDIVSAIVCVMMVTSPSCRAKKQWWHLPRTPSRLLR